jgi:hypothetical protein
LNTIDPYTSGKFKADPYAAKTPVSGSLAVVLRTRMEDRGLALIKQPSRCVRRYDIHELILTDEADAKPGAAVNRIAYLGFLEIEQGGVIVSGDGVWLDGRHIGTLAGFDETHMPNHLNIVIRAAALADGLELGAALGMSVKFASADKGDDPK